MAKDLCYFNQAAYSVLSAQAEEIGRMIYAFSKKLISENLEAVFVSGETKGQFKKALVKTGHYRDIASIERFGFLENIVTLRESTTAPGIIADIGKFLKNCKLNAIRSERIKKLYESIL